MKDVIITLHGVAGSVPIAKGIFNIKEIGMELNKISQVCDCEVESTEVAVRIPIRTNSVLDNMIVYDNIISVGTVSKITMVESSNIILDVVPKYGIAVYTFSRDGEDVVSVNFVIDRNLLFGGVSK